MIVAGSDRTINRELARWYTARAKSHPVGIPAASHVVYISHAAEVAATIEQAAQSVGQ
jgi:pimeloyl-ACP methyl ester carboxylesterase